MGFVTRKKIKETKLIVGEPFFVSQWNGYININKWSGTQRANLLLKVSKIYNTDNITSGTGRAFVDPEKFPEMFALMAEVVASSICDENGVVFYDVNSPEDIEEIKKVDGDLLQILFMECANRNGLLDEKLKEEIKNLEAIQN